MTIDPSSPKFAGQVRMEVTILRPLSTIWLHAKRLKLVSAKVSQRGRVQTATVKYRPRVGQVGIAVQTRLREGRATVVLHYQGQFAPQGVGLFTNRQASHAFTHFQPVFARRAFPCFDEPRFKIPWQLTLVVPENMDALSNVGVTQTVSRGDGFKRVVFEQTPALPSYLLAFTVGLFKRHPIAGTSRPTSLLQRQRRLRSVAYATRVAKDLLTDVERYLDDPMPYPKLDILAVPNLAPLAMENPGLITVRESAISPAGARSRLSLRLVLAHELAHLWFGDLVTPRHWDDLWLSEGLAFWLERKLVLQRDEEGSSRTLREAGYGDRTMKLDERSWSQPIQGTSTIQTRFANELEGNAPKTIGPWSRTRSWMKSAAVMDMLEAWLGPTAWRAALRQFVATHRHQTATAFGFASVLARATRPEVASVLQAYVQQPGLPRVAVRWSCRRGRTTVLLSQRPYAPIGDARAPPREHRWTVPVCLRYPSGRGCVLLRKQQHRVRLPTTSCPRWIHPSSGGTGYYRFALGKNELQGVLRFQEQTHTKGAGCLGVKYPSRLLRWHI